MTGEEEYINLTIRAQDYLRRDGTVCAKLQVPRNGYTNIQDCFHMLNFQNPAKSVQCCCIQNNLRNVDRKYLKPVEICLQEFHMVRNEAF